MKASIVTFRANHGKRLVSCVCMSVCAIALGIGVALNNSDLTLVAGATLAVAAAPLFVSDSIIIDGRRHVIVRRRGIWPIVVEVTRPFSDFDHVCVEEMPEFEPDGLELTVSRLTLVRKFGSPIILASVREEPTHLRREADHIAQMLGVQARTSGPDLLYQVSTS